ncbi:hypothetical protein [Streptomyces sp. NBC_01727]|uniref:hypothetical protein n=1 Tax=Streptomyces sp. NBC_01727 TaxID=2975924 RepID=UPI002E15D4A8|nr:hypothetical protein OIE76_07585 [Streptomyces sp. NBC_01727]
MDFVHSQAEFVLGDELYGTCGALTAAVLAGYHGSVVLHHGVVGDVPADVSAHVDNAIGLWSRSYRDAVRRWPTAGELNLFSENLTRLCQSGGYFSFFFPTDLFAAAVSAGTCQDPSLAP